MKSNFHFTATISRTIDIDVNCKYYADTDRIEIIDAQDLSSGEWIELEDDEIQYKVPQEFDRIVEELKRQADEDRFEARREMSND
tara:strand:- start:289 stop:543 length:255 start_codon:yes stop_codon:yes gene_type:complete